MSSTGLTLRGVGASLANRPVLDGVSLHRPAGTLTCVLGPNGAGKTTLLRVIAGLQPFSGEIFWRARQLSDLPARERARTVSYLPQGGTVGWPLPVRSIVSLGRLPHGRTMDRLSGADQSAIAAAMERTDIAALADRPATALSGGERARVLLARALAVEADLLLADEPVASVDPRHQLAIMDTLRQEARGGRIVIAVLHDLALAARYADTVLILRAGRLVGDGAPLDVLTPELAAEVFGISVIRDHRDGRDLVVPWDLEPQP
jgi:iron complex transport system ATP-binding protein